MKNAFVLVFCCVAFYSAHTQPNHPRRGFVDLRAFDFNAHGHVGLAGEWAFYMRELIDPDSLGKSSNHLPGDFVSFPIVWNDINKSRKPGEGYGTFYCRILVKPGRYALEVPHFYSSYKLWINNELISFNGEVGTSNKDSKPQWLPRTVAYNADTDTLNLVIHVSNYFHAKGGVRENILLGTTEHLNLKRKIAVNSNLILFAGLVLIFLMFIIIFAIVRRERTSLYFALFCGTWAVRSVFSNLYLVTLVFPDFPWEIAVKTEYITLYLTMIWAICFISALFPEDVNKMFKNLFVSCNLIFVMLTVIFSASTYTEFLPVYLSFSVVLLVYVTYVLIHAFVYERQGVWMIVSCIMLGIAVYGYDISAYQGLAAYSPIITNVGYLTMFILLALALAFQFGILSRTSRKSDMLTYDDLYKPDKK